MVSTCCSGTRHGVQGGPTEGSGGNIAETFGGITPATVFIGVIGEPLQAALNEDGVIRVSGGLIWCRAAQRPRWKGRRWRVHLPSTVSACRSARAARAVASAASSLAARAHWPAVGVCVFLKESLEQAAAVGPIMLSDFAGVVERGIAGDSSRPPAAPPLISAPNTTRASGNGRWRRRTWAGFPSRTGCNR